MEQTNGESGQFPLQVRTMDLNDELGQITHIFSDKTGTFTLNYMEFRKVCMLLSKRQPWSPYSASCCDRRLQVSINGVAYGKGTTEIGLDRMKREGMDVTQLEVRNKKHTVHWPPRAPPLTLPASLQADMKADASHGRAVPHVNFDDGSDSHPGHTLAGDLAEGGVDYGLEPPEGSQAHAIHHFLLHLVLNHTVVPEVLRDEDGNETGRQLSASSPDEEAFVYAGEFFKYAFVDRQSDNIVLQLGEETVTFKVLHVLAYNQMRKRMSVIVRFPDGRLFLYDPPQHTLRRASSRPTHYHTPCFGSGMLRVRTRSSWSDCASPPGRRTRRSARTRGSNWHRGVVMGCAHCALPTASSMSPCSPTGQSATRLHAAVWRRLTSASASCQTRLMT